MKTLKSSIVCGACDGASVVKTLQTRANGKDAWPHGRGLLRVQFRIRCQLGLISVFALAFAAVASAQTNVFPSTGNVGVATSNPTALLQVGETIDNQGFKVGVSGNMGNSNAEICGSLVVLGKDSSHWSDVGAVAWNFFNNGNNPTWSGAFLRFYGSSYPGTATAMDLPVANQAAVVFQNASNGVVGSNGANIHIAPAGTVRATFLTNGNVGIGTKTPSHRLSVNGTVRAKEVIVDTGWADFVFEPNYALPSLDDIETHIIKHRRLPNLPSAADVAQRGIGVGEMQTLLLQKIEELTLHLIRLEKEKAGLEARLRAVEGSGCSVATK